MINDKELEEAAKKRAMRQCTSGCEHMDKAIQRLLIIGFEDGAKWALGKCEEKIEELRDYVAHKDSCSVWNGDNNDNIACTCGLEKIGGIG